MKRIYFAALALTLVGHAALAQADGKALYNESCKKCHGALGTPPAIILKKFDKMVPFNAAFFAHRSMDSIVTVLTKGKGDGMKSFQGKLTADEMMAVAMYVQTLGAKPKS